MSFNDTLGIAKASEFDLTTHSSHRRCGIGHDRSLFLERVDKNLICYKCKNVCRFIINTNCNHSFCHCCILNMSERADKSGKRFLCPIDKKLIKLNNCEFKPKIEEDINALRVQCVNHKTGCKENFPLANMEYHINNECKHRQIKCEVCDENIMMNSLDDHLKDMNIVRQHVEILAKSNTLLKIQMEEMNKHVALAQKEHSFASTQLNELRQVLEEVKGHQKERLDVIEEYLRHKAGQEIFPSSTILNDEQQEALHEFHPNNECGWALLYKATISGLLPEVFHNLVDGHRNTMIIFQSGGNDVFGGFASRTWDNLLNDDEPQWKEDEKAYVFSLSDDTPTEIALEHENEDGRPVSICCHNLLGPTWGNGEQIFMGGRFGTSEFSVTADGTIVYSNPGSMSDDQIKELEVYVQIELE